MRHKTEAQDQRWMDNRAHGAQMAAAHLDLHACCLLHQTGRNVAEAASCIGVLKTASV